MTPFQWLPTEVATTTHMKSYKLGTFVEHMFDRWTDLFVCPVDTADPAARSAFAAAEFVAGYLDATRAGIGLFGTGDPADELIACQWGDVVPGGEHCWIGD